MPLRESWGRVARAESARVVSLPSWKGFSPGEGAAFQPHAHSNRLLISDPQPRDHYPFQYGTTQKEKTWKTPRKNFEPPFSRAQTEAAKEEIERTGEQKPEGHPKNPRDETDSSSETTASEDATKTKAAGNGEEPTAETKTLQLGLPQDQRNAATQAEEGKTQPPQPPDKGNPHETVATTPQPEAGEMTVARVK